MASVFVGVIIVALVALGVTGYEINRGTALSYAFDREIGDSFELAHRASDALTKHQHFLRFVTALEKNGLTSGQTSFYFPRAATDLGDSYKLAKSLLARLENLSRLSPRSLEYQAGMQQITLQEFCGFPMRVFKEGWYLKHGFWNEPFFPHGFTNRCSASGK